MKFYTLDLSSYSMEEQAQVVTHLTGNNCNAQHVEQYHNIMDYLMVVARRVVDTGRPEDIRNTVEELWSLPCTPIFAWRELLPEDPDRAEVAFHFWGDACLEAWLPPLVIEENV